MPRQNRQLVNEKLVAALAAGKTVRDAALAAGVTERTVYRRLADAAFKISVMEARSKEMARAAASLTSSMSEASAVLRALLAEGDPKVRRPAAVKLLELGVKFHNQMELERRLEQLERFMGLQAPLSAKVSTKRE